MFGTLGLMSNVYFQADESAGGTVPTPPPATPTQAAPTPDDKQGEQQRAELDRIAKAARRDGEKDGVTSFLKELGFEKADDLKSLIQSFKEKQEAEMSETDRLKKQIDTLTAEKRAAEEKVIAAQQQALKDKRNSKVVEALGSAKYPKMILNDLDRDGKLEGLITDTGDIDEKAIEKIVIEAKKAMPDLFRSDNPGNQSHAGAQPGQPNQDRESILGNRRRTL